ncbi:hypothetical protein PoB_003752400 [Plakobranchus ocellatus]|uniref:Uncharacterized protein n=1 Tax=Plakobranchus ocellatus TaxID=259542 RepID=A0AAV4AX97_9GAST|nr:hypothetical protein PoB_003752400 [Plakobranchus ocellatus]
MYHNGVNATPFTNSANSGPSVIVYSSCASPSLPRPRSHRNDQRAHQHPDDAITVNIPAQVSGQAPGPQPLGLPDAQWPKTAQPRAQLVNNAGHPEIYGRLESFRVAVVAVVTVGH